jgi:hypothetical protein
LPASDVVFEIQLAKVGMPTFKDKPTSAVADMTSISGCFCSPDASDEAIVAYTDISMTTVRTSVLNDSQLPLGKTSTLSTFQHLHPCRYKRVQIQAII